MNALVTRWIAFGWVLFPLVSFAQTADQLIPTAKRMDYLQGRLAAVRSEMATVQEKIQEENARYVHFQQHDAVFTNGPAASIHKQVVALERQLKLKRDELEREMRKIPGLAKIRKQRKVLYEELGKLRDRELLIRKEIDTEQIRLADPARRRPVAPRGGVATKGEQTE